MSVAEPLREEGIPSLIERHSRDRADRTALVVGDEAVTWRALGGRSRRLAAALWQRGIEPGARVALLLPLGVDLYVALLALFRLGAVAVLVDPGLGRAGMERALTKAAPRGLIGVPKAHLLRLSCPALRRLDVAVVTTGWIPGAVSLGALEAAAEGPLPAAPRPDAPAVLTFTSGTTGAPRAAVRTQGLLLAQHRALCEPMATTADDVDLHGLPLFVLHSLAAGATAVLPRLVDGSPAPHDPAAVVAAARSLGVTTVTGSPTFLAPLAAAADAPLASLRAVFAGGAVVAPALIRAWRRLIPHGDAHIIYGSTEAEPIAALDGATVVAETAAAAAAGAGACVGRPCESVRVRLDPVAGEVGEVLVAGDHVVGRYFDDPAADAAHKVRDADGTSWHRTGDCARLDGRGRLWLMGRRGDQLGTGEGALWPLAAQGVVEALDGVVRAALMSIDGEAVMIVEGAADAALVDRVRAALDGAGLTVAGVRRLDAIPTDRRHHAKIDRAALRRILA